MEYNLNTKRRNRQNSHTVGYFKNLISVVERTSRQKYRYHGGRLEQEYQLSFTN